MKKAAQNLASNMDIVYFLCILTLQPADVAKSVDALDLGSSAARHGGSSPSIRTQKNLQSRFKDMYPRRD